MAFNPDFSLEKSAPDEVFTRGQAKAIVAVIMRA